MHSSAAVESGAAYTVSTGGTASGDDVGGLAAGMGLGGGRPGDPAAN
ncbi:hypothetical protein ACI784_15965 [Geodermatophilus sp. SYSU D01186]